MLTHCPAPPRTHMYCLLQVIATEDSVMVSVPGQQGQPPQQQQKDLWTMDPWCVGVEGVHKSGGGL